MTTAPTIPLPRKSRRGTYVALLISTVVLAGAGYLGWQKLLRKPSLDEQYIFASVQRGGIEDLVTATGTLQPSDYVDVGAQVSGQLKAIHVEVGSKVKAGDLLAEIDATVFAAKVDASRAQLRSQRALLKDKEAAAELAALQVKRQKNLMAADATTTETLQNTEATLRSALAQIDSLRALIEQNESSLRADEANLNYAHIYAPMSGTVVSIPARKGQTLNSNQQAPTILRIADMSTMTVQTQVSEADISKLHEGMEAYFTTLGNPEKRWYGKLRKVEPTPVVQNSVVLFNALFDVDNASQALMPQMTAQVFFVVASVQDTLSVPASSLTLIRGKREGRNKSAAPDSSAPAANKDPAAKIDVTQTKSAAEAPRREKPAAESTASKPNDRAERIERSERPADAAGELSQAERAQRRRDRMIANGIDPDSPQAQARMRSNGPRPDGESSPAMDDAARRARREARMAADAAGNTSGNDKAPDAKTAGSEKSSDSKPKRNADKSSTADKSTKPNNASKGSTNLSTAGPTTQRRSPRQAKVRVLTADGKIEERTITVGVSNRVQVQVLDGLNEGERIIAGDRIAEKERAAKSSSTKSQASGLQGGNTGGGGGGGPGR